MIVHWLSNHGYEVIALCLDLGQKVEDLDEILEKGQKAGAAKVLVENVEEEFVKDYVFSSICLLYTSPSPRDPKTSRMPSSA